MLEPDLEQAFCKFYAAYDPEQMTLVIQRLLGTKLSVDPQALQKKVKQINSTVDSAIA